MLLNLFRKVQLEKFFLLVAPMLENLVTVKKSIFEKTQLFYQICQTLHFCSITDFCLSIIVKGNVIIIQVALVHVQRPSSFKLSISKDLPIVFLFRLRAYFPKILFPEKYHANIGRKHFSNVLHAFCTPTHFPKKLARFLLQQNATPPNLFGGVARCFNK